MPTDIVYNMVTLHVFFLVTFYNILIIISKILPLWLDAFGTNHSFEIVNNAENIASDLSARMKMTFLSARRILLD